MNNEQSWVVLGVQRGRLWLGRRVRQTTGGPTRVRFDGKWAMSREEQRGDVLGWLHTHPGMRAIPSSTDIDTMRAWVLCFGKPLLCFIYGRDGLRGWLFHNAQSTGQELDIAESFRSIIIGVQQRGRRNRYSARRRGLLSPLRQSFTMKEIDH